MMAVSKETEKTPLREYRVFDNIQRAIDECAAAGGGTVVVPNGEWHTGALHLKSNITLHLEPGAQIHFSDNPKDYLPFVFTRWEGTECYNYSTLIYARDCENVAVTGSGRLIGNGQRWWDWKLRQRDAADELYQAAAAGVPPQRRIFGTDKAALRPSFIQFIGCKNILLDGFSIEDGPQWTIHPIYCENVTVRNVNVSTHGPNTDGLNPDSCKNVLIENCTFETGDDCIAINSGLNEDGWRVNKPCENVEIRNCRMTGGHGGIVIGSAMSGGVKGIYAHDCEISGTMWGIRIKSMRGRGGCADGAVFENITINNVSEQAVSINMFYETSTVIPKTDTPSELKNIELRNICGKGAKTVVELKGLPELKLKNIILDNINLTAYNNFVCSNVEDIVLNNVKIREEIKDDKII